MLIYFGNCLRGSFGIRIVIFKVVSVSIFIFFFFWRVLRGVGRINWLNEGI